MSRLRELSLRPVAFVKSVRDVTACEKQFLLAEMIKVRGLMPLLMNDIFDLREIARQRLPKSLYDLVLDDSGFRPGA